MTAKIIDGKEISKKIRGEIADKITRLKSEHGITPTLAVILVGQDKASQLYVGNKEKAAHQVGMNSIQYKFADTISQDELIAKIRELNADSAIHGILVQLPLPAHMEKEQVIKSISYKKDVDGFNIINVGKLSAGQIYGKEAAIVPCTPRGCLDLIKSVFGEDISGKDVVMVGTSNIVGRPMAQLLLRANCTVTMAHKFTKNLKEKCIDKDVVITATGVSNLIKADMIKKGAVVIDVGINRITLEDGSTKLVGDVDFENVRKVARAITPVPGGVGPMTITYLLCNTLEVCLKRNEIELD